MTDTTSVGDYNIFGQPLILSSSSRPNWADLAIERAAEIERLRTEIERMRAAVGTAQESLHQAMERIRFMEATKRPMNPVAKGYLEQAERVLAEVLGDE